MKDRAPRWVSGASEPACAPGPLRHALTGAALLASAASGAAVALSAHFARRIITPDPRPDESVAVVSLGSPADTSAARTQRSVTLVGTHAGLPGKFSFIFDDGAGHARVGAVLDSRTVAGRNRATRELLSIDRGALRVGARGRITGWWYTDPAELGRPAREVEIPTVLGPSPAWVVEADPEADGTRGRGSSASEHWAVHVHGRGARREETLRGVPSAARAGLSSVVISYRNDVGAPRGLRGRYGLGLAEQYDVDSAIAWAREQGGTRVTLFGYSMGATAAMLSATRGRHRELIDGLVLDSPALDWPGILRQQARLARVPRWVATLGRILLQRGVVRGAVPETRGTDINSLTPAHLAVGLGVPVLIHASPEDTFVPWQGSLELGRLRPDLVALRECRGEHVKLWNTDPQGWEGATEEFLRGLPAPRSS